MTRFTFEELDTYLLEIDACKDLDEILTALQKQITKFGFDRFTYWLRWGNKDDKEPVGITTYPDHYINHYIENDYQSHDMVGRLSTETNIPFLWSDMSSKYKITKMQKVLFDDSQAVGIKSGASIPIHGPNFSQATFSVVSDINYMEFDKLFKHHRHELQIIATYAHEKIMKLGIDTKVNNLTLTARETEILTWVSRGKTYWEIGQILKIQEDTVKKYMQRIFGLLDVTNNTHAVAKAIINGLIIP